jgi:hypothetical protein
MAIKGWRSLNAGGNAQRGATTHKCQGFSADDRHRDSAVLRHSEIRHKRRNLIFLGNDWKKTGVEPVAEAFQLGRRKDNVLLQIEKGLFLTCIVSEMVTVTKDRSPRQRGQGYAP